MARSVPDWPRMLRRDLAAAYCDLSAASFEREVSLGTLPGPILLGNQPHWSRVGIDEALERLTGERKPDWRATSKLYAQA